MHASIKQNETELAEITPRYAELLQEEGNLKSQLDTAEGTRQRLYAKQGRNARYHNKRERDTWLRDEINKEVRGLREQLDGRGASNDAIEKEIQEARGARDKLMDERKLVIFLISFSYRTHANIDKKGSCGERMLKWIL